MSYYADIRLATTDDGVWEIYNNPKIPNPSLEIRNGEEAYVGWNDVKIHEIQPYIQDVLKKLEKENISYQYAVIGEELSDIRTSSYDGDTELWFDIGISRSFDDKQATLQTGGE